MSDNELKILTQEARFRVRLNYVIFPIDFRELVNVLAKNGYELIDVKQLPPPPTRIGFSGELARKEETTVTVETGSCEIGVISRSVQKAKSSFDDLAKIIDSELSISLHKNVRFYACVVHYRIDTGKMPHKEIPKTQNKEYIEKFSQVLGEKLSSFSIRVAPKGLIPNADNWFDIAMEPDIINEKIYHVGVVFRNSDRDKTETFVKDLESKLMKLIEVIEA